MLKKLIPLLFIFLSCNVFAEYSMRKCLLLPITDSVGGAIAYKVHQELEDYLMGSGWCSYSSNSPLIAIFAKYRNKLESYLKNPDVIQVAAEKTQAGSILRINLVSHISGVEVQFDVVGDNGVDIYFSEKVLLNKDDVKLIVQTIKNWLLLYEKNIPYDGRVVGVLGDQITIDIGRNYRVGISDVIKIRRAINKKRHPLLKRIVEWETIHLAKGKIFNVSDDQALGTIKTYTSKQKVLVGDWVSVIKAEEKDITQKYSYPEVKANEFGKIGNIGINLEFSKTDVSNVYNGSRSVGSTIIGLGIESEVWITREYLGMFEFGRRFGALSRKSGTLSGSDTVSITEGTFKLMGGYRYLPLGFFYGPQVDFYGGYGVYSFNMDSSTTDGFGENEIGGIIMGVKASIPLQKVFRAFVKAEVMPIPKFKETAGLYGAAQSESSVQIELGTKYRYNPLINLNGSLQLTSNKASFAGGNQIHYRSTVFKFGGSFSF